jgi:hypothetical protein
MMAYELYALEMFLSIQVNNKLTQVYFISYLSIKGKLPFYLVGQSVN